MNVKISGFYDEVDFNLDNQIKLCKQLGESYICPRKVDDKNIADYTLEEFKAKVKPRLDKAGIKYSSIGSPIGKVDINDDEGIAKQKKQLAELIKIAELMECKYIRIFSFYVKPEDYAKNRDKVMQLMREFVQIAEGTDVILLHENEKGIFGATDVNCLDIYKTVNSPHLQLIYDASNFIQCDVDPEKAFDLLKDYVVYYHIKDCDKETKVEVPVGSGDGQYKKLFKALKERNFEGFMTLEPHTIKYAVLKAPIYFIPFAPLIAKKMFKAFRKIDKYLGRNYFQLSNRKEVFVLQYNNVKKLLREVNE